MARKIIVCFFLFCISTADAQDHLVKWNPLGLVYRNVSLSYELKVADKQTLALWVGYMIPMKFDQFVLHGTTDNAQIISTNGRLRGWTFTPEFRFYLSKEKSAPAGFYAAPYFRYGKYGIRVNLEYIEKGTASSFDGQGFISEIGGGVQLGYNLMIANKISVDLFFLGPRISWFKYGITAKGEIAEEADYDWENVENNLKEVFARGVANTPLKFDKEKVHSSNGEGMAKTWYPFIYPNYRFGISLGIAL